MGGGREGGYNSEVGDCEKGWQDNAVSQGMIDSSPRIDLTPPPSLLSDLSGHLYNARDSWGNNN